MEGSDDTTSRHQREGEGFDFRIEFSANEKETRGFASSRCSTVTTRDESSGIL